MEIVAYLFKNKKWINREMLRRRIHTAGPDSLTLKSPRSLSNVIFSCQLCHQRTTTMFLNDFHKFPPPSRARHESDNNCTTLYALWKNKLFFCYWKLPFIFFSWNPSVLCSDKNTKWWDCVWLSLSFVWFHAHYFKIAFVFT